MHSPYPGMDPYLESPVLWPDVHNALLAAVRDQLGPALRPRYCVRLEARAYSSEPEGRECIGRPELTLAAGTTHAQVVQPRVEARVRQGGPLAPAPGAALASVLAVALAWGGAAAFLPDARAQEPPPAPEADAHPLAESAIVRSLLDVQVALDVDAKPLTSVVQSLAALAGQEIVLDSSACHFGWNPDDTAIRLRFARMPLALALLRLSAPDSAVGWLDENGALRPLPTLGFGVGIDVRVDPTRSQIALVPQYEPCAPGHLPMPSGRAQDFGKKGGNLRDLLSFIAEFTSGNFRVDGRAHAAMSSNEPLPALEPAQQPLLDGFMALLHTRGLTLALGPGALVVVPEEVLTGELILRAYPVSAPAAAAPAGTTAPAERIRRRAADEGWDRKAGLWLAPWEDSLLVLASRRAHVRIAPLLRGAK
ncbi:MAG: DUF4058 family protein [Planctomycetes bacterium]|nr:DUF4058 family protein [Planctomycetota bacterium]